MSGGRGADEVKQLKEELAAASIDFTGCVSGRAGSMTVVLKDFCFRPQEDNSSFHIFFLSLLHSG